MEKTKTVVGTFLNEIEAEMAQHLLEGEGIQAEIQKDDCGGMYPQLVMVRGIKILVSEANESAARSVLESNNQEQKSADWICPKCSENVDSGFSVCWNCGQENN